MNLHGGPRRSATPTIDPAWLLRAVAISIGVALLCGYASFCALFYQGQWQVVLHPTRGAVAPAWAAGDPGRLREVHFGPDASGTPQLTGWWFAAAPGGRYEHLTALYLPSGDGQVARASSPLPELHRMGLNVLAFDYRGYGESAAMHPSEERMREDAEAALRYLGSVQTASGAGVRLGRTVLYGTGVGGALAVALAKEHPEIPVIVLDGVKPDLLAQALRDPRARLLPVRLLFKERFQLFPALAALRTPKLIITRKGTEDARIDGDGSTAAADPKTTVALPDATSEELQRVLSRFLDQYAPPTPVPQVMPSKAPMPTAQR